MITAPKLEQDDSSGSPSQTCCVSLPAYSCSPKSKRKARPLFDYLLALGRREVRPLPAEQKNRATDGATALEWFVANESQGKDLPTRHPLAVEKIIIARAIKGLTKDMWIEDLRSGLITRAEVLEWAFSPADAQDVINRAFSPHNAPVLARKPAPSDSDS